MEINDVSMILYPGARHEILNEINYTEVYMDVEDWIRGLNVSLKTQSDQ